MTQEEKAKAYDEALEVMRQWIAPCHTKEQLDTLKKSVFPELAESEDERMKRIIMKFVWGYTTTPHSIINGDKSTLEYAKEVEAYLEKQKEPTTEELYAEAGTTEKEYIANTMKMVRAMREKKKEQKPAEWSEKDDQLIGFIFDLLNDLVWRNDWAMSKEECLERLKSLRPQPRQEWSEGDEKQIRQIERIVKDAGCSVKLQEQIHNWFKSLCPSWKPSKEQMEALDKAIPVCMGVVGRDEIAPLESLYEQLKKL